MTTVEDIQTAIANLSPDELARLRTWLAQFQAAQPGSAVPAVADEPADATPTGGAKYPNITVRLSDLKGEVGPIIRRVSYALSDADVSDDEIEQYKEQAKASNPVSVTKRWVRVE